MEYTGEHLLAGQIGNFFVVAAFAFALLSAVSYFFAERKKDDQWKVLGRVSLWLHSLSVVGMVATLFFMIFNQYFEYHYVWQHSSTDLPLRFIFSCFWEGVEGSFMLWMFWHVVLANLVLISVKKWEASVMTVILSVQVFLVSMLLGVYIFDFKLGSNPFTVLMREHPDFMDLPIFKMSDYVSNIDGRGLNPLLQNYWMTIHPPLVLFGFATSIIPFAYAIAGLWKKQFIEWVKPALPWTFFGIGVLGTGVLMGGAWAYEALSFGGFWAWDPVENSSLVPWLTMVAGGHLMLIQRKKGTSVLSMFVFITLTFCLVQYSSFLTKSGVLGETSVHSFTDLGMTGQLAISLLFFVILSGVLIAINAKDFPRTESDESLWSREFWMFIGALVLFISAFQISFSTSFPVINQLFGTNLAPSSSVADYYNSWQLPLAIIISYIIAIGQLLKYKKTDPKELLKKLAPAIGLALIVTVSVCIGMSILNPLVIALLFGSSLAAFSNLDYWARIVSGKIKMAGASIAHVGFSLILLGALISTSQQETISQNTSLFDISVLGENYSNSENILLVKDDTLIMGDYFVSYRGKTQDGIFMRYQVDYFQPNESGSLDSVFSLYPYIQMNPRMGNVAEPYTKHYLTKDIFTHITYAELEDRNQEADVIESVINLGDTIFAKNCFLILTGLDRQPDKQKHNLDSSDLALGAVFNVYDVETKSHTLEPLFVIRDNQYSIAVPDSLPSAGVKIYFESINPETQDFSFRVEQIDPRDKEFIVMGAIVFPAINVLWIGSILMALGTFLAVVVRIRRS